MPDIVGPAACATLAKVQMTSTEAETKAARRPRADTHELSLDMDDPRGLPPCHEDAAIERAATSAAAFAMLRQPALLVDRRGAEALRPRLATGLPFAKHCKQFFFAFEREKRSPARGSRLCLTRSLRRPSPERRSRAEKCHLVWHRGVNRNEESPAKCRACTTCLRSHSSCARD